MIWVAHASVTALCLEVVLPPCFSLVPPDPESVFTWTCLGRGHIVIGVFLFPAQPLGTGPEHRDALEACGWHPESG